ncbi:hypothetical protein BDQ12DRAFT_680250 [Crucibulum laeve]|uniref:Uncharacterized protein n=1 Tax=Crucibulum laeve TaxID=68775 RepID=A0A5C3M479_9AGAR|nr:hypothetical protein BDQ12DRAFT_680250 [Crucibulum laeve]
MSARRLLRPSCVINSAYSHVIVGCEEFLGQLSVAYFASGYPFKDCSCHKPDVLGTVVIHTYSKNEYRCRMWARETLMAVAEVSN